jgi:eukaryotic-like serine/threonine-protein kinase
VKIVRMGMNTESIVARFEVERQALALMDHPNIARVFEAGSTDSGRPYFVMEFVEGEKITAYCERHQLTVNERLMLFVQVCNAIQHAHLKGVVHRDIKPSNILVSHDHGVNAPKVIDFGIAKALDPKAFTNPVDTSHDQLFGTPDYMSPEQVDLTGLDVDTRSDIYSLGILLYELLTVTTPFAEHDFRSCGISKVRETLLTAGIEPPSRMLGHMKEDHLRRVASTMKTSGRTLIRQVRGDLDWIVAKATERDRTKRYQTANGIALDVQRYLATQPVTAAPHGNIYLLDKFVRSSSSPDWWFPPPFTSVKNSRFRNRSSCGLRHRRREARN